MVTISEHTSKYGDCYTPRQRNRFARVRWMHCILCALMQHLTSLYCRFTDGGPRLQHHRSHAMEQHHRFPAMEQHRRSHTMEQHHRSHTMEQHRRSLTMDQRHRFPEMEQHHRSAMEQRSTQMSAEFDPSRPPANSSSMKQAPDILQWRPDSLHTGYESFGPGDRNAQAPRLFGRPPDNNGPFNSSKPPESYRPPANDGSYGPTGSDASFRKSGFIGPIFGPSSGTPVDNFRYGSYPAQPSGSHPAAVAEPLNVLRGLFTNSSNFHLPADATDGQHSC